MTTTPGTPGATDPTPPAQAPRPPRKGSRASRAFQLRRVLSVLAWFRSHPDATLMTTAERFGVSVPQLREELTQVAYSGLPGLLPGDTVDLTVDGAQVTLNDLQGLGRPLALTGTEAAALELNLEKLASILADGEREAADAAASVLRSLVRFRRDGTAIPAGGPGTAEDAEGTAGTGAAGEQPPASTAASSVSSASSVSAASPTAVALARLREAVTARRWVRFPYLSVSSDSRTVREIIPDTVAVLDGVGYLWGRADAGQGPAEQRCFSVARMDGVEVLDRPAPVACPRTIPADDPFGFLDVADSWAQLTLTEEAMWMLEYLPVWHVGGTTVEIPDTGQWLDRFLLAYAPEITAVAPADIAARAGRKCAAALAAYGRLA